MENKKTNNTKTNPNRTIQVQIDGSLFVLAVTTFFPHLVDSDRNVFRLEIFFRSLHISSFFSVSCFATFLLKYLCFSRSLLVGIKCWMLVYTTGECSREVFWAGKTILYHNLIRFVQFTSDFFAFPKSLIFSCFWVENIFVEIKRKNSQQKCVKAVLFFFFVCFNTLPTRRLDEKKRIVKLMWKDKKTKNFLCVRLLVGVEKTLDTTELKLMKKSKKWKNKLNIRHQFWLIVSS